jgi:hypothetical protein
MQGNPRRRNSIIASPKKVPSHVILTPLQRQTSGTGTHEQWDSVPRRQILIRLFLDHEELSFL